MDVLWKRGVVPSGLIGVVNQEIPRGTLLSQPTQMCDRWKTKLVRDVWIEQFFFKAELPLSKENIVHHKRSYPGKLPITSFPLPHLTEIHKVSEQSLPPPLPHPSDTHEVSREETSHTLSKNN